MLISMSSSYRIKSETAMFALAGFKSSFVDLFDRVVVNVIVASDHLLHTYFKCVLLFIALLWVEHGQDRYECSSERSSANYSIWIGCICCHLVCLGISFRNNHSGWDVVFHPGKFLGYFLLKVVKWLGLLIMRDEGCM